MTSSRKKTRKKADIKKVLIRVILIIILLTVVLPFIGGICFYQFMFGKRYDPDDEVLYKASDFEGLTSVRSDFTGSR